MNKVKKVLLFVLMALTICTVSVPTFAKPKNVKVTLVGPDKKKIKNGSFKGVFTIKRGSKLNKKQIKTAKKAIEKWYENNEKNVEIKNCYSNAVPAALKKKRFSESTKISVTQVKQCVQYIDTLNKNTVYEREYLKKGDEFSVKKAPTHRGYKLEGLMYGKTDLLKSKAVNRSISPNPIKVLAVYTPITYTITYNLNKGKMPDTKAWNNSENRTSYNVNTKTFTIKAPHKDSWIFTGWTGTGLSGKQNSIEIKQGSSGNRKYNATWKGINYVVYFNPNGGFGYMNPIYAKSGKSFTLPSASETPFTKEKHTLVGWMDRNGTSYKAGRRVCDILTNLNPYNMCTMTLYAVWRPNKKSIKVTVNKNGGKDEWNNITSVTLYGAPGAISTEDDHNMLPTITYDGKGYTFREWVVTSGDAQVVGKEKNKIKFGTKDSSITARWDYVGY